MSEKGKVSWWWLVVLGVVMIVVVLVVVVIMGTRPSWLAVPPTSTFDSEACSAYSPRTGDSLDVEASEDKGECVWVAIEPTPIPEFDSEEACSAYDPDTGDPLDVEASEDEGECVWVASEPPAELSTSSAAPLTTGAVPAVTYTSLNYDETNSDPLTVGQNRLVAEYLREAMGAGGTQAAMESAIMAIQIEAANAQASVFEGATLILDQHHAWLVWCSDASGADFPTDTSDVFDTLRQGHGMVWIQVPFAPEVPLRSKDTFSGCNSPTGFWAVAVH
jgi:hypothetical protein